VSDPAVKKGAAEHFRLASPALLNPAGCQDCDQANRLPALVAGHDQDTGGCVLVEPDHQDIIDPTIFMLDPRDGVIGMDKQRIVRCRRQGRFHVQGNFRQCVRIDNRNNDRLRLVEQEQPIKRYTGD